LFTIVSAALAVLLVVWLAVRLAGFDPPTTVTLDPGVGAARGASAFDRCRLCHEPTAEGARLAPSLRGIIGRPVAAEKGYTYSRALASLGGVWSEDRLDAFLRDPGAFARGSQMEAGGVADPAERQAIVGFLKSYR
jgi:cytochrome c2